MALSAMGLKLGIFGFFANHTRTNLRKTNASTIFAHHAAFCLWLHVYAQTAVDAGDTM